MCEEREGRERRERPRSVIIFVYVTQALLMPAISAHICTSLAYQPEPETSFLQILKYRSVPSGLPAVKTNKRLSAIYVISTSISVKHWGIIIASTIIRNFMKRWIGNEDTKFSHFSLVQGTPEKPTIKIFIKIYLNL